MSSVASADQWLWEASSTSQLWRQIFQVRVWTKAACPPHCPAHTHLVLITRTLTLETVTSLKITWIFYKLIKKPSSQGAWIHFRSHARKTGQLYFKLHNIFFLHWQNWKLKFKKFFSRLFVSFVAKGWLRGSDTAGYGLLRRSAGGSETAFFCPTSWVTMALLIACQRIWAMRWAEGLSG